MKVLKKVKGIKMKKLLLVTF